MTEPRMLDILNRYRSEHGFASLPSHPTTTTASHSVDGKLQYAYPQYGFFGAIMGVCESPLSDMEKCRVISTFGRVDWNARPEAQNNPDLQKLNDAVANLNIPFGEDSSAGVKLLTMLEALKPLHDQAEALSSGRSR